jgi:hypothetical protein
MAQNITASTTPVTPSATSPSQTNTNYLSQVNNITPVSVGETRPAFGEWRFPVDGGAPALYAIVMLLVVILILLRQGKSHDS